jgi:hypothetical protein
MKLTDKNFNTNKQYLITKHLKKEIDEISFQVAEKKNNNQVKNKKLSMSIGTFENSSKGNNTSSEIKNDHIPLSSIFGIKKQTFFNFNKKK